VESGNDPGRDEYGLPPVDVEIPDDPRDLDRDVQAYYRELRARRRRVRIRRLTGPLTRHGMVLPLVAACLALTLLTGSLLTVLSGRQVPLMRSRLSPTPPQGTSDSRGLQLPNAMAYRLSDRKEVQLSSLAPAVLAWVPAVCTGCRKVLKLLASQTARERVHFYFVGHDPDTPDLVDLTNLVGPKYSQRIVNDTSNALSSTYGLAGLAGVTAILAHSGGLVPSPDVVELSSQSGLQTFETRLKLLANAEAAPGSPPPAQQPAPQAS
jgi:hypothetical protein